MVLPGRAAAVDNLHTAYLAIDQCLGRTDHPLIEILAAHTRNGAGKIAPALYTVTDDDSLLQDLLVRGKRDRQRSPCGDAHRPGLVTDIGDLHFCRLPVYFKDELSVKIGDSAFPLPPCRHGRTDKGFPIVVRHRACHRPDILCERRRSDEKDKENHTEQARFEIAFVNHIGF